MPAANTFPKRPNLPLIARDKLPARISIRSVNVFGELGERVYSDARNEANKISHHTNKKEWLDLVYEHPHGCWIEDEGNKTWGEVWQG